MIRLILVLALCSSSAFAQTLTKPPSLLKQVEPQPPDGGITTPGTVVMEVDLGPDGKVLEVRVVQGVSPELDAGSAERFVGPLAGRVSRPAIGRVGRRAKAGRCGGEPQVGQNPPDDRRAPVCRLPVAAATQTGVGTGRLDHGDHLHRTPATRTEERIIRMRSAEFGMRNESR